MLDLMRRKKRLKSVLWLVIVSLGLGMLLLFVPGTGGGGGGVETSVATVAGESIPVKEYLDTYKRFVDNITGGGRNKIDPATVRALGIHRQALDALVSVRVINYAAHQLGLQVSDEELQRAIQNNPNFQNGGVFVGPEIYKAVLAQNNIAVAEFEDGMRSMLLREKIRDLITDSLTVSDREIRDEFQKTSQEAQAQYVLFRKDDFAKKVVPTEAELKSYFEANKPKYSIKEQRRAQYLMISLSSLADSVKVPDQDVRALWDRQDHQETVDASHILFEVKDPSQEAEVRARAEAVLKRARAGEDFSELAKKYSDDKSSAAQGGNLGPFPRDRMVKEFSDAAFSLKPGEISDLVRTQFGFHIIKVLSHNVPSFETARSGLERSLQLDRASELMRQKIQQATDLIKKEKDLAAIAKALNVPVTIRETGFVSRDADASALGLSSQFIEEVFKIKEINALGEPVDAGGGTAIPKLLETHLPRPAEFAEVRPAVEKDLIDLKATEAIQAAGKSLVSEANGDSSLEKAAQRLKLPVKTTQSFKRDAAPDPELGVSPQFSDAAFGLPIGGISEPILLDGGSKTAVLQVKSRTPFDEAEFAKQRGDIEERILNSRREVYFQAYIKRVTSELEKAGKIRKNLEAADRLVGATS